MTTPNGRVEVRLIAGALPEKKVEEARRRLRKNSRKKGHTPSEISLVAAGFVLLMSNLPVQDWPAQQVLAAYRLRWQVELLFKRLKGILALDAVRAKDPVLSQVYLMGKLVGMLMLEDWQQDTAAGQPEWFEDVVRPVSQWRWVGFCTDMLRQAVRGVITAEQISKALPKLGRYFRDSPRKRQQQAAHARHWLNTVGIPVEVFGPLTHHESVLAQVRAYGVEVSYALSPQAKGKVEEPTNGSEIALSGPAHWRRYWPLKRCDNQLAIHKD